jgi:alanyl-tRNA synthetase
LREAVAVLGGKGGGAPDLAQGGGPQVEKLGEALERARGKL